MVAEALKEKFMDYLTVLDDEQAQIIISYIETIDFSNIQSIYTDYTLDEMGKIRGSIFDVDSSRNLKEIICTQSLADIFNQHPEIILNKTDLITIKG